ncbi:MAG: LCP family protein [Clostridiales bacterium]|nr:LCP family protein [Clostridiales bacterium]
MKKKPKKVLTQKQKLRRRIIWLVILALFVAFCVCACLYIYPILNVQKAGRSIFPAITRPPVATKEPTAATLPELFPAPRETVSAPLPGGKLNILLIGVDLEDKTYSADYHSDTMIVLAVDFAANTADMISLRRDTFAYIPGVRGVYKLNGSINCGGGLYAPDHAGFLKVCEAAEWMLGGLPVDYYVALQLPALIEIVDVLGGVDYDVDIDYGNTLKRGFQHLDGNQVMRYVRARKDMHYGAQGDVARVARQKKMLLAILKKLQNEGKLTQLPQLLGVVQRGIFTNLDMQQLLALLNFARTLDADAMGTYSFDGPMNTVMGWSFCFPDQAARIALIEQIYGVTVEPLQYVSRAHAIWYHANGFYAAKRIAVAGRILNYAEMSGWAAQSAENAAQLQAAQDKLAELQALYFTAQESLATADTSVMRRVANELQRLGEALAKITGYPERERWYVLPDWTADSDINEVYVDFR